MEKDFYGVVLSDLLMGLIRKIYEVGNNGNDDSDMISATVLFIALMENN